MAKMFGCAQRYLLRVVLLSTALLAAPFAQAQGPHGGEGGPQQLNKIPEPPAKLPRPENRRTRGLDFLFGALKVAPDAESAKAGSPQRRTEMKPGLSFPRPKAPVIHPWG